MISSATPILGVMEYDPRAFFDWGQSWRLLLTWLQDAGGFAALGLALWFIYVMLTPSPAIAGARRKMISKFMAITAVIALFAYLITVGFRLALYFAEQDFKEKSGITSEQIMEEQKKTGIERWYVEEDWLVAGYEISLAAAGLIALIAFCEPFVMDFVRFKWRRILAIAKLSFKEPCVRRIVWVFLLFALVFLFPARWFTAQKVKPEDDLKTTISVISIAMTGLFVLIASLLASFSIPTDVKNQTIHTIVTKPVERFEIVIGRFLGYVALLTVALGIITAASVLMIVTSNIDPAAREESMKARVAVYGELDFSKERIGADKQLERKPFTGIDVGREYSYRKYIPGGPTNVNAHRAIWSFGDADTLRRFKERDSVPMEFAFDVYRTTKGEENKGVGCSFDIVTWKWDPALEDEYRRDIQGAQNARPSDPERWKRANEVAEKYGRFTYDGQEVVDYHTYTLEIPPGLFKNALAGNDKPDKDSRLQSHDGPAYVQVKVHCISPSQLVGVATLDLYFLDSNGTFWLNFFKAAIGLWCRLCIVIGLAVAASTYLAGVVSFLLAIVLFLGGYFLTFIQSLALNMNQGGGPFESFSRLVKGTTVAAELDKTPSIQVALFGDRMFRWLLRRIINVIPDTERFTWSNYLSQGFSIEASFILLNLVYLFAYMLPWAVLAYYLIRSREVAA